MANQFHTRLSHHRSRKFLADKESLNYKRAEFADNAVYVTRYRDGEFYAAGKFTNQSRGGDGVRTYAARKDNVKDTDIVVWVQFGLNHIPRIEDFPVMPVETIRVSLKPVNFFTRNPAIDVPPSTQVFNLSTLLSIPLPQGAMKENGKIPLEKGGCCNTSVEAPSSPSGVTEDGEKGSVKHNETCSCGSIEEGQTWNGGGKLGFREKIRECCNVS